MPVERARSILLQERGKTQDVYLPLRPPDVRLNVGDSLAPAPERYYMTARVEGADVDLKFTPTSFRQLCSIASVPAQIPAKAPAALGLNLLRSMLEMSEAGEGALFLLRLRLAKRPVLRAILPRSFVRIDDVQVADALECATGGKNVRIASMSVDEDTWFARILLGDSVNLGNAAMPDSIMTGMDLITSETGLRPMEIRHVLFRVVCANGITRPVEKEPGWKNRYTAVERPVLEGRLADALDRALMSGGVMAGRLSESRAGHVEDAGEEIARIFRDYRLGNPRGRIGTWIAQEVMKENTLFGVSRWTICQAFTFVARGLDHSRRMQFEDAMGSYLVTPASGKS